MVYHARARAREPRTENGVLSCIQHVPKSNKPSTTGYTFSTPFCTPFYITRQLNIFINTPFYPSDLWITEYTLFISQYTILYTILSSLLQNGVQKCVLNPISPQFLRFHVDFRDTYHYYDVRHTAIATQQQTRFILHKAHFRSILCSNTCIFNRGANIRMLHTQRISISKKTLAIALASSVVMGGGGSCCNSSCSCCTNYHTDKR